jgi:hypothetical protein
MPPATAPIMKVLRSMGRLIRWNRYPERNAEKPGKQKLESRNRKLENRNSKIETRNWNLISEAQERSVRCIKLFSIFELPVSKFQFLVRASCITLFR